MRAFMTGLCLAALAFGASAARDPSDSPRGRSRILVISAPAADDAGLAAQRRALEPVRDGMTERDLRVVEAVGDGSEAAALRRRYRVPGDGFHVVLVGKDGGTKLASETPIPPRQLFDTIDTMPMRRDEIRSRRGQTP